MSRASAAGRITDSATTRGAFRCIVAITLPLLVTSLAQILLPVIDTVLVGRVSTEGVAALGLAVPVYVVAVMTIRGWSTGTRTLVAQHHGANREDDVAGVLGIAVLMSLAISLAVAVVLVAFGPTFIGLLGADDAVADPASRYLRLAAFALPFLGLSAMLEATCSGLGRTRVLMLATFVVLGVKVPSAAIAVLVLDAGLDGAAVSTVLATAAGCLFLLVWGRRRMPDIVRFTPGECRRLYPRALPALWRIGWPETTSLVLGMLTTVIMFGFIADLGEDDIAAYRIVTHIFSLLFTATFACSNGVAILVGQRLGARDPTGLRAARTAGLRLGFILVGLFALPFLVAHGPLLGVLSPDDAVVDIARGPVWLAIAAAPIMVLAMNLGGVLRAAGDTRSTMVALLTGSYLVQIPLGWLLHDPLGVRGLALAAVAYWITRAAITGIRYRQGTWRTRDIYGSPQVTGQPR